MTCACGCGREPMPCSLFAAPCSAAIAWRASGRLDVPMPSPLPAAEPKGRKR